MSKKIFICSKLGDKNQHKFNLVFFKICKELGFEPYLPQIEVPFGISKTPLEILEANEKAIDSSDLALMIFDKSGAGGAMEYQRIYISKKPIIAYRSKKSLDTEYLGMMLEGAWQRISNLNKGSSVSEIKNILKRYTKEVKMENKNLKELQEWVKCFVDERGWKNNPGDILTHMVEELGEVARNVLHMKDYGGQHTFKEDINMGEELADLMYLLLKMSNECNVDLGKSFRLKMEKNVKRFPKKY